MEAGSGALLDELDAIIPHISGGSASVEDFVAKKKAVSAAHQDNPRHIEASYIRKYLSVSSHVGRSGDGVDE